MELDLQAASGADIDLARLADLLRARGQRLCTAESCTGGMIAAACTSLAGSSDWFERGFVTYSNLAKVEMLGVDQALLDTHGAVSEDVALQMVQGALSRSAADWGVAVTGIAGPGGAVPGKPVGTVWLALGGKRSPPTARLYTFDGDRRAVREQTVQVALQVLCIAIEADVASNQLPAAPR